MRRLIRPRYSLYLSLSLAIALVLSCSKTPEEKMTDLYETGIEHLAKFDFDGAVKAFDEIRTIDSSSPMIDAGKGLIAEQHLFTVDAYIPYGQVIKDHGDSPLGYEGALRVQRRLGAYEDALTTADQVGKISPRNPHAIAAIADAALLTGLPQIGSRLADSARRVGLQEGEVNWLLARAEFLTRDFDSADYYAKAALGKSASTASYYEAAADYYEAAGKADSSMLFSEKALNAKSELPFQWIHHFDRALRLGYFASARSLQREIGKLGADSATIYESQAEYFNATRRFVEATNVAIWMTNHTAPDNLMRLTQEMTARAGMTSPGQMFEGLLAIREMLEGKKFIGVVHQFFSSYFYTTFGPLTHASGGEAVIDMIYGPAASRRDVNVARAQLALDVGEFKKFDSLLAILDKYHYNQADWQAALGDVYAMRGPSQFDKAKERYERGLSLDSLYLGGFTKYLTTLEQFEMYKEAEALFERYPYFAAHSPALQLRQARALIRVGRRAEAMPMFESAITLRSGDMRAIAAFLAALDFTFDKEGKDQAINTLAKLAPKNPDIIVLLSDRAIDEGKFEDGFKLASDGIKTDPTNGIQYMNECRAMFGNGKQSEALAQLDSLYPAYQNDPAFTLEYSKLLAENGINADKAANLARGAVYYASSTFESMVNLARTYYLGGRYDLAWNEGANTSAAYPTHALGFYYRGLAAKQLGKPEAKEMLEKSISLGLGGNYLADAQTVIAELK